MNATKTYQIVTYGTAMGKHTRTVDPVTYATREAAQDVIDERAMEGDQAAENGRMKIEESE